MNKKLFRFAGIRSLIAAMAVTGGAALSLTSCDDLLEMPSYTDEDEDFAFSNLENADLYVAGCYRDLIYQEQYYQFNSGETITAPSEENFSGSKFFVANYFYDPLAEYTLSTSYKQSYRVIEECNIAINRLSEMDASEKRNALLAEAKFIRAYAYHTLIRFYGDVPFVTAPLASLDPEDPNTFYPKRTSRDVIYDALIADMTESVEDLYWLEDSGWGAPERISRQAGYGIMARICLHAAGYSLRWDLETLDPSTLQMKRRDDSARVTEIYQIADDALSKALGRNSLMQAANGRSGFENLFYQFCQRNWSEASQEWMWCIAQYGTVTNGVFGIWQGQPGATGGTYGSRKVLTVKLPTYYLSFNEGDTRRDVTCANFSVVPLKNTDETDYVNAATSFTAITNGKFRISWTVGPADVRQRNIDIPLLRYADILLMYAETQNFLHGGPTDAAKSALAQVRERAGVGSLPIPTSEAEFLDAVIQERKWEFGDEFMMRSDLIRTDLLDRELKQAQEDLKALSKREGKYANVGKYRICQLVYDAQVYGQGELTVPFIEITDPDEVAIIESVPSSGTTARAEYNAKLQALAAAHGADATKDWYAVNMFEQWTSTFNRNARLSIGFANGITINLGASMRSATMGYEENGNAYPEWVDGSNGLYFGYERNKSEILPFANAQSGNPLFDNPNLSQHPAYL